MQMEGEIQGCLDSTRKRWSERIFCKGQAATHTRHKAKLGESLLLEVGLSAPQACSRLSLYKILFYFNALWWESNLPFIAPPHLQSLPCCITIARPLRNIRPPTASFFLCNTPYNIGEAISCQGQLPLGRHCWLAGQGKRTVCWCECTGVHLALK